MMQQDRRRRS
ncbi:Protein kinase protein with adenine nucleotide alpha hydrolase-like domain [Zea mays]|uniref:Protein kinase protein with adenine nucleotide alpha hydrolase-like domain n=1 Tax=Zea mays TaxID=4577 RepID=A0A1D6NKK0_MAIZE|nr:Protein kinase protein with adenine nucleotide alpha hydrolase-like domain [Zea mays]